MRFRFEDLEIWQRGAAVTGKLFKIAEALDTRKHYRFGEQLRAATLSITNNVAEGSGSDSKADFANFINTARRSVFEVANILIILTNEGYLKPLETEPLLNELAEQSRMLNAFKATVRRK